MKRKTMKWKTYTSSQVLAHGMATGKHCLMQMLQAKACEDCGMAAGKHCLMQVLWVFPGTLHVQLPRPLARGLKVGLLDPDC